MLLIDESLDLGLDANVLDGLEDDAERSLEYARILDSTGVDCMDCCGSVRFRVTAEAVAAAAASRARE